MTRSTASRRARIFGLGEDRRAAAVVVAAVATALALGLQPGRTLTALTTVRRRRRRLAENERGRRCWAGRRPPRSRRAGRSRRQIPGGGAGGAYLSPARLKRRRPPGRSRCPAGPAGPGRHRRQRCRCRRPRSPWPFPGPVRRDGAAGWRNLARTRPGHRRRRTRRRCQRSQRARSPAAAAASGPQPARPPRCPAAGRSPAAAEKPQARARLTPLPKQTRAPAPCLAESSARRRPDCLRSRRIAREPWSPS